MAEQKTVFGVEMTGFGGKLPRERYSNARLIRDFGVDSDPDWIREHTGIRYRHIAGEGEHVAALGYEAGLRALRYAGIEPPAQVDYMFVASSSADTYRSVSGAHPGMQKRLRKKGYNVTAGHDINLACTGFIRALLDGYHMFDNEGIDSALVVGTENLTKKVDFGDRGTSIVFADGAGAVLLQRTNSDSGLHGSWQETDSDEEEILYSNYGEPLYMEGPRVLKHAIPVMIKAGEMALAKAQENTGIMKEDIDYIVPHQANIRIIEPATKKLGFDRDQLIVDLDMHGNSSTASIPLALVKGVKQGKIKKGTNLLMPSFGGGMTYMAAVVTV